MPKIMRIYYDNAGYPYKDSALSIRYPIVEGGEFTGANNTTEVHFYTENMGSATWVANCKLPDGTLVNRLLVASVDDDNVPYQKLPLDSQLTSLKGHLKIGLNGYSGNISVDTENLDENEIVVISGTPQIIATGIIDIAMNYSPIVIPIDELTYTQYQQLLALIGSKLDIANGIYVAADISVLSASNFNENQIFYDKETKLFYRVVSGDFVLEQIDIGELNVGNDTLNNVISAIESAINTKVDKSSVVSILYGTDNSGNQTTYNVSSFVDLTSTQTIGGTKSISGRLVISGANFNLFNSQITTNSKNYFARVGTTTNQYVNYNLPYSYADVGAQTYTLTTKEYVDNLVATLKANAYIVVDTTTYPTLNDFLATSGEEGYIYLYPINTSDLTEGYYQYIWENNAWLLFGTTKIDLSNYVDLTNAQTISGAKVFTGGIYKDNSSLANSVINYADLGITPDDNDNEHIYFDDKDIIFGQDGTKSAYKGGYDSEHELLNRQDVFQIVDLDSTYPATATQGTLSASQLATLQANDLALIHFNNQFYRLQDMNEDEGYMTYSNAEYLSNEHTLKTITITISTLAWVLNAGKLAETNGYYAGDGFGAYSAKVIDTDTKINVNNLILLDSTGGSADIGTGVATVNKYQGLTVIKNQWFRNQWWSSNSAECTFVYDSDTDKYTITKTSALNTRAEFYQYIRKSDNSAYHYIPYGHIVLQIYQVKASANCTIKPFYGSNVSLTANTQTFISAISTINNQNGNALFGITILPNTMEAGGTLEVSTRIIVDLSQFFGATSRIPNDYSVDDFIKEFGWIDFSSYDSGTPISVETQQFISVGYNQLDLNRTQGDTSGWAWGANNKRTFEQGKYYVGLTANNYFDNTSITSVSLNTQNGTITIEAIYNGYGVGLPIRVLGSKSYTLEFTSSNYNEIRKYVSWYDKDGNFVSYDDNTTGIFTSPINAYWGVIVLRPEVNVLTTYSNICFHLTWSGSVTGYKPYEKHTYDLPQTTLYGIYGGSGDVMENGTTTRKIDNKVFDGSSDEVWNLQGQSSSDNTIYSYYIKLNDEVASDTITISSAITTRFLFTDISYTLATEEGFVIQRNPYQTTLYLRVKNITSVDDLKTWLANNNLQVYWELASPTTEDNAGFTTQITVNDYGTTEFVGANGVPAYIDIDYQPNLVDYLRRLYLSINDPTSISTTFANFETRVSALETKVPTPPTTAGTYVLKVVVDSNGNPTYSWVSE